MTTSIIPIDSANIFYQNQRFLSFCSHDYLALSDHSDIKKNAMKFLLQYGISSVDYEEKYFIHTTQRQLEEKLSEALLREDLLFFPSASLANQTLFSLFEEGALFIDESSKETLFYRQAHYFNHSHLEHLDHLLTKSSSPLKIIATESIFSLGGDCADLAGLIALKERHGALLCVDDSHSIALFGEEGMGLASSFKEVDIISGALGKGCGVYGGFVAGSKKLRHSLIEKSGYHLLPAAVIGGLDYALELIPQMEGERKQLQQRAHFLRNQLTTLGFDLIASNTPLISLLFSTEEEACSLRKTLLDAQIFIASPRPYKEKRALQLCLTSSHTQSHLSHLFKQMTSWKEALVAN